MTLLNQPRVSATELAKRFEVSLRTIYRDMEAINQAGISIVSFAGSDGGNEIMSGYRLDKQVLSLEDFYGINYNTILSRYNQGKRGLELIN
jgi:predicted DNA-binding transcriptional regulator YafY